jgi:hypothetical protein
MSLTLLVVVACGCKKETASKATLPTGSGIGANQINITNLQLIAETEAKERDDFKSEIRAMTLKGDFQKLESMAEEFRSPKLRFRNGWWKLRAFYVAFGDNRNIGGDEPYRELIGKLESWAVERPDSITPRLALVEAYHGYAWVARGSGWASQVTEEGAQLMEKRIEKGFEWLKQAHDLPQQDPALYAVALHLCLGANVAREEYEKYFETGVRNASGYNALYEYKAYYLLPRWHGRQGEWESFARKMTQRKDIAESEEIYARIAIYLRDIGLFYDEFSASKESWEELKSSFQALEKKYPDSLEIKSIFCNISGTLCDYKEAREQMKLLDGKVDLSVWHSKENFLGAVEWANNDDATLESERQQFLTKKRQSN